ncbi:MAG: hypothetical protein ACK4SZ_01310 [Allosphingosinicella sp.]|uniref:hypothetical protein n=1 Tax=Allosphingosinicella sp. TaxID=2823234 RepID=UPI003936E10A
MITAALGLLAQPALPPPSPAQQASVQAYQLCLAPIVRANARAEGNEHQPLDVLLQRISTACSAEREAAREALAAFVFAAVDRLPSDGAKDELIHEATIRWANTIASSAIAEDLERE